MNTPVSDEILNAFIDNELEAAEHAALLGQIARDASLRGRACELWQTKQLLRSAFPLPRQAGGASSRDPHATAPRWMFAMAASLLLTFGAACGWQVHEHTDQRLQLASEIDSVRSHGGRVVVHLVSGEPARMQAALQKVRQLAEARERLGEPISIELLANGEGLHLLRAGGSPFAEEVDNLRFYDNLRVVACGQAIARLKERGIDVALLPGVEETPSAETELARLLTRGWRYVQT